MQVGNTERSWGAVQRMLHWTIAAMVIGQLIIGDIMLLTSSARVPTLWYYVHPTVGILIGALMLARLAWRRSNPKPEVPNDLSIGEQALSQATHYAFYWLLILNPIVGWLLVGTLGEHVHFFTAVLPNGVGPSSFYKELYFWMHLAFGAGIGGLFLVHAGAALHHEFDKRDNVLRRMLGFPPMTAERQIVQETPQAESDWADERHARPAPRTVRSRQ